MLLFQYLDALPSIPLHLLNNPTIDMIGFSEHRLPDEANYTRWSINNSLVEWLLTNITTNVNMAGLQKITWNDQVCAGDRIINPHCDKRKWAINYIIETGGPAVTTTFYHQPNFSVLRDPATRVPVGTELKMIKQVIIEPNKWHILNTNVLHGVENVETQRQAITIGLNTDFPLEHIRIPNGA
jgi:hypothetical protein